MATGIPHELAQIISKALEKSPKGRYQTIAELRYDLEKLKEVLIAQAHSQSSFAADPIDTRRTSSAEYLLGELKRNKLSVAVVVCAGLLLIAGSVGLFRFPGQGNTKTKLSLNNLQFTKITTSGNAGRSAISPDGKFLLYSLSDNKLIIRHRMTGSIVQLPTDPEITTSSCSFSPDSNYIYCAGAEMANTHNSFIVRIPVLPGPVQKFAEHIASTPTVSPDGKRVAFVRVDESSHLSDLVTTDSDGRDQRVLGQHNEKESLLRHAAWSPDGKIIAVIAHNNEEGCIQCYDVVGYRTDNGAEERMTGQSWQSIQNFAWMPDSRSFLMAAVDRAGNNGGIWQVSYPGGEAQRLTSEIDSFVTVSISADASQILSSQIDRPAAVWLVSSNDAANVHKLTPQNGPYGELAWTPDGQIVYDLSNDLWIMSADGSSQRQLTFGPGKNYQPSVTGDGRYVVFTSSRGGGYDIWRLKIATGELKQLTSGVRAANPVCTPDGQSVIYQSSGQSRSLLWEVSLEGGTPKQIGETNLAQTLLDVSPDGKLIVYEYQEKAEDETYWVVRPIEGGSPQKICEKRGIYNVRWSADSKGLLYAEGKDIWIQPINGGPPKRLTSFPADRAIFFAQSRDGKYLAVTQGNWNTDIVLISVK
jgi:Tol biopolymer transport system component